MKDEFYLPDVDNICAQSDDNKQGRADTPVDAETAQAVKAALKADQQTSYETYEKLIAQNIARELARINLPLSTYTEWYWTMDLHNLFRFLRLRMDQHAQYEIRVYAEAMYSIVKTVCPMSSAAFEDHVVGAVRFSASEMDALRNMIDGRDHGLEGRAAERLQSKIDHGHE